MISHALDLLEQEHVQKLQHDWLYENREAVRRGLEVSEAAKRRGESYSAEEVRAHFAQRRAERSRA